MENYNDSRVIELITANNTKCLSVLCIHQVAEIVKGKWKPHNRNNNIKFKLG